MSLISKLRSSVLVAIIVGGLGMSSSALSDVRIDIKNERAEDCSVAFNARVDKTKWMTIGWYVFVANEEGPVILKGANDYHDVFIYHDCDLRAKDSDELKRAWVKTNLKFTDFTPKDNEDGYEEVEFVRLNSPSYVISANPYKR